MTLRQALPFVVTSASPHMLLTQCFVMSVSVGSISVWRDHGSPLLPKCCLAPHAALPIIMFKEPSQTDGVREAGWVITL